MAKELSYDEDEHRKKFRDGMRAWLARSPRDITHTLDGRALYCPGCYMYLGTTRSTHECKGEEVYECF